MDIGMREFASKAEEETFKRLEEDLAEAERQIAGHKTRISNLKIPENKRAGAAFHLPIWEKKAERIRSEILLYHTGY